MCSLNGIKIIYSEIFKILFLKNDNLANNLQLRWVKGIVPKALHLFLYFNDAFHYVMVHISTKVHKTI